MSASKAVNADNPVQVLKLLKKKGRTSAPELGADRAIMNFLEAEGFVRQDGTYKTGKKGKPPVAWVPAFDYDPNDAPVYKQPVKRERAEVSQATIDKVIADVTANRSHCQCIAKSGVGTTAEEIRAMGVGTDACNEGGKYVCPTLDSVRRQAKLFGEQPKFQEVV